jgi:hypothetical protein
MQSRWCTIPPWERSLPLQGVGCSGSGRVHHDPPGLDFDELISAMAIGMLAEATVWMVMHDSGT